MCREELYSILSKKFGKEKTAYYDFHDFEKLPKPPYIAYLERPPDNFSADNKTYFSEENFKVELYIQKTDLVSEKTLENLFNENDIYFEKEKFYIQELGLFQVVYEI